MESLKAYKIELSGHIEYDWSKYFEQIKTTYIEGNTILSGAVIDQSALHGLIARIRDLNLVIVSVKIENPQ